MSQDSIDLEDRLERSEAETNLLKVLSELSDSAAFCAAGEVGTVLPACKSTGSETLEFLFRFLTPNGWLAELLA